MPVEIRVPEAGESITEVEVGEWLKAVGDAVEVDEPLVILETDKAALEMPAPTAGVLIEIVHGAGDTTRPGEVIALLEEGAEGAPSTAREAPAKKADPTAAKSLSAPPVTPAARRLLAKHSLAAEDVNGSGTHGRILKEDVQRYLADRPPGEEQTTPAKPTPPPDTSAGREEEVVRMSLLRRRIAERLVQAQQTAALLTTFNEVDMSAIIALRAEHRDRFLEQYQTKLGFMSFFVKAAIAALKQYPQLNAEIRDDSIVYRNYYDIGVAVGTERGLVVPILRDADRLSFAETETLIADFARRANENRLTVEELQGGTFTITNGGVYGSLLSTPIVNPPQSGILGMHSIQERPVALDGEIVIRPMMYLALTYDHRVVDGREAVTFLRRIKECVEDPERLLLEV